MGLLNLIAIICIAAAAITAAPTSPIKSPFSAPPTIINTTAIASNPMSTVELKKDTNPPIVAIESAELRNLTAIVDGKNVSKNGIEMKLHDNATAVVTKPSVRVRNIANTGANSKHISKAIATSTASETSTADVAEIDPSKKYRSGLTEYGYCQRIRREMPRRRGYSGARKTFHFNGRQPNREQVTTYHDLDVEPELFDENALQELFAGHPALEDLLALYKTYKYNYENEYKTPSSFFDEEEELPMRSTFEFFV